MIVLSDETQDIDVPHSGAMRVHLFRPATPGTFPGVLLFSESIRLRRRFDGS